MSEEEVVGLEVHAEEDFLDLVDAEGANNERAWMDAYDRVYPKVLAAIVRQFGGNPEGSCAEAVQSAFRVLIRRYAPDQSYPFDGLNDLTGYLIKIATNKMKRKKKRNRKEETLTEHKAASITAPVVDSDTEEKAAAVESAQAEINRVINGLRSACNRRDAQYWPIVKEKLAGMTKKKIAEKVGCSEKKVTRATDFASKYIRDRLDESFLEILSST